MSDAGKTLIVDRLAGHRQWLVGCFDQAGGDILTAGDPWEAVDLAACYRPALLLSGYRLTGHVTGVQLLRSLRLLHTDLRAVLVTSFESEDMRHEAQTSGVSAIIGRAAQADQVSIVVQHALQTPPPSMASSPIGAVLADADGQIEFANEAARFLLATTRAGCEAVRLDDALVELAPAGFDHALDDWALITTRSCPSGRPA